METHIVTVEISHHAAELRRGQRFEFGKNWRRFLVTVNDERIARAEQSLQRSLGHKQLDGKKFLDIGSGSGLFSLAARRLGGYVRSFDYDPQSVACTNELRRRYLPRDKNWVIEQGSILDRDFLAQTWSLANCRCKRRLRRPDMLKETHCGAAERPLDILTPRAAKSSQARASFAANAGRGNSYN